MKHPRYPVKVYSGHLGYEFFSEGPTGRIKKKILYEQIGKDLFNLSFGDWNEERGETDDSSRSNNGDRDKVLMTVAFTALIFTDKFPGVRIFIEGSTTARTRLYQMGIAANLPEINLHFEIQGFNDGRWQSFRRGQNYEAFLICRK